MSADAVILALGGASWPQTGSTGAWVPLLAERGILVNPLKPANCGFDVNWTEHFRSRFGGHPLKSVLLAFTDAQAHTFRQQGEFIITDSGVEGSLIYACSALLRDEIAAKQVRDMSGIVVTVHPACHYYKLVEGDAIYDPDIYGGQRTAVVTGLAQALGAEVRDYSTWFDCCGFGFRHILVQRDFTRSFATLRKIEVMKEEANPDVVLTHDTGCVTTLDKSQFAARAHERNVGLAVLSEAQFAALAMGAHPYRVCQLHWHSADYRPLLEKLGIDWEKAWAEFQSDLRRLESGEKRYLDWDDVDA